MYRSVEEVRQLKKENDLVKTYGTTNVPQGNYSATMEPAFLGRCGGQECPDGAAANGFDSTWTDTMGVGMVNRQPKKMPSANVLEKRGVFPKSHTHGSRSPLLGGGVEDLLIMLEEAPSEHQQELAEIVLSSKTQHLGTQHNTRDEYGFWLDAVERADRSRNKHERKLSKNAEKARIARRKANRKAKAAKRAALEAKLKAL